ncbi:glutamate receptor 2-like [Palaemon carinicauda]|uniref:glutamate receptor 2-like n=1 Tax=Palaemon carinicauda TaxID=392227 RepID=UPI0035B5EFFA
MTETGQWMPHIILSGSGPNLVVTGTMLDVLDIFAQQLGFCYKFVITEGAGVQLKNGSWTGQMNLILNKEIAYTGLGLAIDHHRSRVIDFSEFLYIDEWSVAFKRPQFQSDIAGFVKPYTAMFASLLTGYNLTVYNFFRYSAVASEGHLDFGTPEKEISEGLGNKDPVYEATEWTLASMLSQSIPKDPRGGSVRIISGMWVVTSFILATVYRSNLKAMLILPTISLPFNNLEELYDTGLPVWVPTASIMHNAADESPRNSILGRLRERFVGIDAPTNVPLGIRGMSKGKHAFAAPLSGIVQIIHSAFSQTGTCSTYVMSESFFKTTLQCLFFPKHSPWKNKLDPLIIRLRESGILNHIYKKGVNNATECLKPISSQGNTNLRPMDLGDFYGVFLIYLGGERCKNVVEAVQEVQVEV